MFEMQDDEISSLSLMDVHSDIDVGQVIVNPNMLLLEDVCFKADDVVQVNSYRMNCQMQRSNCQMWMADCQNSDFHVLQILKLEIGQGGMHNRVHNDQLLHFVGQIISKQVQRIPEDYLWIIYLTFAKFLDFRAKLVCVHQCIFFVYLYHHFITSDQTNLHELIESDFDGRRIQTEYETLMLEVAEVFKDRSSDFEVPKSLILMSNVQFNFQDVFIVKKVDDQIDYLTDLGPNLFDKGHLDSIQLGGFQMPISEGRVVGFTSLIMSKQVWRIKSDSRQNYEAKFSCVPEVLSDLTVKFLSFNWTRGYGLIFKMRRKQFFNDKARSQISKKSAV